MLGARGWVLRERCDPGRVSRLSRTRTKTNANQRSRNLLLITYYLLLITYYLLMNP